MNTHDLIGLRDLDLDTEQAGALAVLLARDEDARREHAEAVCLGVTLATFSEVEGGPTAEAILARARQGQDVGSRRSWRWVGALGAVAAALAVAFLAGPESMRAKGTAGLDAAVRLEAVVDGSRRVLLDGDRVASGEGVVFRVTSTLPGIVWLSEVGPGGKTEVGRWEVNAGSAWVGGTEPLAWTPDHPTAGPRRYHLRWCSDEGGQTCTVDELVLRWQSP